MLTSEKVAAVKALLARRDMSYRAIAARVGVSKGTVASIDRGARAAIRPYRKQDLPAKSGEATEPSRCPTCGCKVYMPCRLCSLLAEP